MRQIRIQKQRVRRRVLDEVPPLDPRDPDVVRVKRMQRTAPDRPVSQGH